MKRRDFLKTAMAAGTAAILPPIPAAAPAALPVAAFMTGTDVVIGSVNYAQLAMMGAQIALQGVAAKMPEAMIAAGVRRL